MQIEYRVRPVTRYIVTRWANGNEFTDPTTADVCGVSTIGEYENAETAYQVSYACCKTEHDRLGWEPGDGRIQYPKRVE